jgi:hypothetical protein
MAVAHLSKKTASPLHIFREYIEQAKVCNGGFTRGYQLMDEYKS